MLRYPSHFRNRLQADMTWISNMICCLDLAQLPTIQQPELVLESVNCIVAFHVVLWAGFALHRTDGKLDDAEFCDLHAFHFCERRSTRCYWTQDEVCRETDKHKAFST
nr:hypothetical protein CFP56_12300 [Quercus suber]